MRAHHSPLWVHRTPGESRDETMPLSSVTIDFGLNLKAFTGAAYSAQGDDADARSELVVVSARRRTTTVHTKTTARRGAESTIVAVVSWASASAL